MLVTANRIRELNDQFRRTFIGGTVTVTDGVHALEPSTKARLLAAVRTFDGFSADNDPHGEHDFGSVEISAQRFFFKIDYYDRSVTYGSPDPSDPSVTTRVLTIMRADEY